MKTTFKPQGTDPMRLPDAHLDFETRSRQDVRKVGALRYAEDESTKILCLSFSIGNEEPELWTPDDPPPQRLLDHIRKGGIVKAHNALFETAIWHYICHLQYGWPKVKPRQWRCVAAKAAAHALPRALGKAGLALGLSVTKDEEGKRVMQKLSKPRKPTENNPSEWFDDPEDYEVLYSYNADDVRSEHALDKRLDDLNAFEQEVWFLDQRINKRGVPLDIEAAKICADMVERLKDRYNARIAEATNGEVTTGKQTARILKWLNDNGANVPDTRGDTLQPLLKDLTLDPRVRTVIECRLSINKTSTAKYKKMLEVVCSDGRIKDILMYHAASTSRWGGKFVQFQNVPKGKIKDMEAEIDLVKMQDLDLIECLYDNAMDFLSWCLRGMIVSSRGKDLVVCDYSSIEARVLQWMAYNEKALDLFRTGECVYCAQAETIYQRKVTKAQGGMRQTGKVAVLALGYQGGVNAFKTMADIYGIELENLYEPVWEAASIELRERAMDAWDWRGKDSELSREAWIAAEIIKMVWRNDNPAIVNLWANMETAAIRAVETGKKVRCGRFLWYTHNGFLFCQRPSGHRQAYYDPKIRVEPSFGRGKKVLTFMTMNLNNQWVRDTTYGGKLTENATQAVARDLMAHAMLTVENHPNYEILFTVHDELVTEAPEGKGSERELEHLMCQLPAWAEGMPVTAEAWRGKRYKK